MMDFEILSFLILAYLLGSIPFGLVLSVIMGTGDLRKIGSGNIGATNALRTGNKKLAALTLLMDMLKGTLAVLIVSGFLPDYAYFAGFLAVVGHMYPMWLRGKGGKGVATGLGVLLGLNPAIFLITVGIWIAVFYWKRISSLSALVAYAIAPMVAYFGGNMAMSLMLLAVATLIFYKHRENIGRLLRGEEQPMRRDKGASDE